MEKVSVIGAGLAGSEAALQIAEQGIDVDLFEMRPGVSTPAHKTGLFAELICSNSLKSIRPTTAHGLLKEELALLGSKLLAIAKAHAVPSGESLSVNRDEFSAAVTKAIEQHPRIRVHRHEVQSFAQTPGICVLSAGPLISRALSLELEQALGSRHLFFFDAVAPIVDRASLDMSKIFAGTRYDSGSPDFLNCPLTCEEYFYFHNALRDARQHALHDFEDAHYFEGCLPVEEMARRGDRTLAFGPLRPVGFTDPATGRRPYAVVQLRREDGAGTMWNLVGFQTRLEEGEQERVFRLIPGLENAQFLRYGKMHRNTFVCAPAVFDGFLRFRFCPAILGAGQITGSEGYVEAIATGLLSGMNAVRTVQGLPPVALPRTTALGSLVYHITTAAPKDFQPMNFNFGLLDDTGSPRPHSRKERRQAMADRSLCDLRQWIAENR